MKQLADQLSPRCTVIHYDRRGRGDKAGECDPYAEAPALTEFFKD